MSKLGNKMDKQVKKDLFIQVGKLLDKCHSCRKKKGTRDDYGWYENCYNCPIQEGIIDIGLKLGGKKHGKVVVESKNEVVVKIKGKEYVFKKIRDMNEAEKFLREWGTKLRIKDIHAVIGWKKFYVLRDKLKEEGILFGEDARMKRDTDIKQIIVSNYNGGKYVDLFRVVKNKYAISYEKFLDLVNDLKNDGLI